jgi:hypothetical protein
MRFIRRKRNYSDTLSGKFCKPIAERSIFRAIKQLVYWQYQLYSESSMDKEIMDMNDKNRRCDNRNIVEWKASVGRDGLDAKPALVRNISLNGAYFETLVVLEVQNRIQLESHVEHAGKVRHLSVECEVMHCECTDSPQMHGYGVRFMKLGRDNLSFLLPIVAELTRQQKQNNII